MDTYYHLHVFPCAPPEDAESALAASLNAGPDELPPSRTEWQLQLSAVLLDQHPSLTRQVPDEQAMAEADREMGAGFGAAYAALQENHFQDENDVYITLDPESAAMGVPLGFLGEDAQYVCECMWEYLDTLAATRTVGVFDPNLGRILDLGTDFPHLLECYLEYSQASLQRA